MKKNFNQSFLLTSSLDLIKAAIHFYISIGSNKKFTIKGNINIIIKAKSIILDYDGHICNNNESKNIQMQKVKLILKQPGQAAE